MDWDQRIIKRSSQPPYEVDVEIMKKIVAFLKKYPAENGQAKILIKQMIDKLSQLISD
jgi:hypothetical protein